MADDLDSEPDATAAELQQMIDDRRVPLSSRTDLPPSMRGLLEEVLSRDDQLLSRHRHAVQALDDPTSQLAASIRTARNNRVLALREELRAATRFWLTPFMMSWFEDRPGCSWAERNPGFLTPGRAEVERAVYERGRADREQEIALDRAAALVASVDDRGPQGFLEPYEPTQIAIDVAAATPEQLRDELRRLDLRLRWILRHYDDAVTGHMIAQANLYKRGVADGRRDERRQHGQPDSQQDGAATNAG